MPPSSRPPFADLPLDKNGPPCNAWGLYGKDDELGALNLITPDTVKAAAKEIQTGERVSLDWYLNLPTFPSFGRPPFGWKMENRSHPSGAKRIVNDDHLDMNTQGSSQWDGFRHYGYQQAKQYYGGRSQQDVETSEVIGIDRIAHSGGITARGVILDYPRYLERQGKEKVSALSNNHISADALKAMLKETGVETRAGDLLLLRTGFTRDYEALGMEDCKALGSKPPTFLGVESSKSVAQWIWESGFVAVAGDAPSFEMSPLVGAHNQPGGMWEGETWENEMQGGGLLHQWLLAGWGVMIGEMWDLEALCEKAKQLGRATCFVSSVPLKVSTILAILTLHFITAVYTELQSLPTPSRICLIDSLAGTGRSCKSTQCGRDILILRVFPSLGTHVESLTASTTKTPSFITREILPSCAIPVNGLRVSHQCSDVVAWWRFYVGPGLRKGPRLRIAYYCSTRYLEIAQIRHMSGIVRRAFGTRFKEPVTAGIIALLLRIDGCAMLLRVYASARLYGPNCG